ncbi:MAG: 50S ribosomal protein L24 [Candidatus Margulisiibacteriota bacterium]
MSNLRIKKNDTVIVLSGKDKGKKGKVLKVSPQDRLATVEAINVVKRHQRATKAFQGGIIEKAMPIAMHKIMLVCPRCSKPTRVAMKKINKKNVRSCKKCSELIDKV